MKSNGLKVADNIPRIPLALFLPENAFTQTPYADFIYSPISATAEVAEISIFTIPINTIQSAIADVKADGVSHTIPDTKSGCSTILITHLKASEEGPVLNHHNQFVKGCTAA
jgi:hypothetical protein